MGNGTKINLSDQKFVYGFLCVCVCEIIVENPGMCLYACVCVYIIYMCMCLVGRVIRNGKNKSIKMLR